MINIHTNSQQFGYGGHNHRSFLRDTATGQVKLVNCGEEQVQQGRAGCVGFGVSLGRDSGLLNISPTLSPM